MTFLQRLAFFASRLAISIIDAQADEVKKKIREHEISIALSIARLADIPTSAVDVSLVRFSDGTVMPKVVVKTLLPKEQREAVFAYIRDWDTARTRARHTVFAYRTVSEVN